VEVVGLFQHDIELINLVVGTEIVMVVVGKEADGANRFKNRYFVYSRALLFYQKIKVMLTIIHCKNSKNANITSKFIFVRR
jgi:hypothetical protein